jgi:hypothetical protein
MNVKKSFVTLACTLLIAGFGGNAFAAPDSCKDPVGTGTWFVITGATINWVIVPDSQFAKVFVNAGKSSCSGTFYFDRTDKDLLSAVLAAKSTGGTVQINFYTDAGSPDITYNGVTATNQLGGVQF